MREKQVLSLGLEETLEKVMATHSSSCLGNPKDGGAWWAMVYGVTEESDNSLATKQQQQMINSVVTVLGRSHTCPRVHVPPNFPPNQAATMYSFF